MGTFDDIFLSIALTSDNFTPTKGDTKRKQDGFLKIFVPCLWSHFLFEGQKGLICLVCAHIRFRVGSANKTNCLKLSSHQIPTGPLPSIGRLSYCFVQQGLKISSGLSSCMYYSRPLCPLGSVSWQS